jgi:alkylated DNA repair dioxygenase AlkB
MHFVERFTDLSLETLRDIIPFAQHSVRVWGKQYPQPRLTAWYGPVDYTYSNLTLSAKELPPILEALRARVEAEAGVAFDTVLANLYRDGQDKIGWHADDEPLFGEDPIIASVSLGATRTFKMRRKDNHKIQKSFELTHGSLLIMPVGTQQNWEHCLPPRKRVTEPRINLTFRPLG